MTNNTNKRNIEAVYALAPTQQGMLFHSLYAPDSGVYVELVSCTLRGPLDTGAFERAWQQVVERHAVLRTSFTWKRLDKMLQVVQRRVELPLEQHDWRALAPAEQAARLEAFVQTERARGFDLARAPLMRLALIRIANDRSYFVWTHHHLLLDGWSIPLLMKEVFAYYEAFARGAGMRLPPPRPYRDYIAWLQQQDAAEAEAFWRQTLQGFTAPTPLGVDRPPTQASEAAGYAVREIRLPAEQTATLLTLAREQQITLNTLVQGAWALLLSRYSGAEDIVFGTTVSGRPPELAGVEEMIGLFINTLPLRVRIEPGATLTDLLKDLHARQGQMRQFEYSPLVEVQGWSDLPRGLPLFESILVFENYPVDASLRAQRGSLEFQDVRFAEHTNYPLTVLAAPGERLSLKISYDCRRFEDATIARMLEHLRTLLGNMAADPGQPLASIELLSNAEQQQLAAWNATECAYPPGETLPSLFAAQAGRSPDAVALVFEEHHLTYQALDARANQLAHHLQHLGAGPDALVGLCLERSLEMLIAIYASHKTGAAYLPLEPSYPPARLKVLIDDARPVVILTHKEIRDWRLEISRPNQSLISNLQSPPIINLETDWPTIAQQPTSSPDLTAAPDNVAYVIYTSGSTGQPKGVMVSQRAIVNRLLWMQQEYQLTPADRVLQKTPFSFDVSVWELFWPLLEGAELVIARPEGHKDSAYLAHLIQEQQVTTLHFVPPMLAVFLEDVAAPGCTSLQRVICSGEALPAEAVARTFARLPSVGLHNLYGPTEAAVDVSFWACQPEDTTTGVPIGRPVANTQLYVLDRQLRPQPIGVVGELYLGGVQLARGYLGRPDLTAERFVPNPFAGSEDGGWKIEDGSLGVSEKRSSILYPPSSARLYRTGDLARYRADGAVEYLGRIDHQVKVRGFRIELGEIEAALAQHPAVREAVVIARSDTPGDQRLVAYLTLTTDPRDTLTRRQGDKVSGSAEEVTLSPLHPVTLSGSPVVGELRAFLKERLPEYMLPSAFVVLEALPLTSNGKLDRKALPALDGTQFATQDAYTTPRTPEEELLAALWSDLLGVARTGRQDNFFDLGGHSLLATRLISRIRDTFAVELPLRDLFETPTLVGMAARIVMARQASAGMAAPPIVPVARDGGLPLSFAQQRLWFLDQLEPDSSFYNVSTAVRLTGALDVAALQQSFVALVRRHETLRTTFAAVDGRPVQVIAETTETAPLQLVDLREVPAEAREEAARQHAIAQAQQPFDLARGPLLRAMLLQLDEQEHIVFLTIHHIISDGWSIGILIREIAALYTAAVQGLPAPLPELPVQYADFAAWQRAWLQGEVLETQLGYWKSQLAGAPTLLELPTDRPRPPVLTSRGAHYRFGLPRGLSEQLGILSRREGATLFQTLLAGFQTVLSRYSGQTDIAVGTPIANRTRAALEGLIGCFVNTLVLRSNLSGRPSFRELLAQVRTYTLDAYAHQDLPFELLVEALQPRRALSHTPLFQVMLVLNNAPAEQLALPGLTLSPVAAESGTARFDLTLELMEQPEGMFASLEYNTDLFDETTIARLASHFQNALAAAVADPEQPIARLPLLSEAERQHLLSISSAPQSPLPDLCLHQLVAQHAARQPSAPAVIFDDQSLSYHELLARASQLAHHLLHLGAGPGAVVGVCLPRSIELPIAFLATLLAGATYLPLDPNYPADRLAFMLDDARPAVLLTLKEIRDWRLEIVGAQYIVPLQSNLQSPTVIDLAEDWPTIAEQPTSPPPERITPDEPAYLIYTSGSTGTPKGAVLAHRGLLNLAFAQQHAFELNPTERVLQFAPLSFDASVWELAMALGCGGALILAEPNTLADPLALHRLLRAQQITNVTLPPSLLALLDPHGLEGLRTVIAAGEACPPALVARWGLGRRFVNAYGPTETTVCASLSICDVTDSRPPTIGRPLPNLRCYVLDQQLQPVPLGVPGELYVGGVALAQAYLGRPDLTAQRFIPDPFAETEDGGWRMEDGNPPSSILHPPSSRLYKTGDRALWRADGQLVFLGRLDQQIKLRGMRIELGEIEAWLTQHPNVREALVLACEVRAGDVRLVAYLIPTTDDRRPTTDEPEAAHPLTRSPAHPLTPSGELRAFLEAKLPAYMIPALFVTLTSWPLTPSGKIDRSALPAPDGTRPEQERPYLAPRTEEEARLAALWAELLGLERVGVEDDFFALGGHSLLATQLLSRLRDAFLVELPLRTLFEHPTIAALARAIEAARPEQQPEDDKLAQLLARLDQLSEEEVRALLDEKRVVLQ